MTFAINDNYSNYYSYRMNIAAPAASGADAGGHTGAAALGPAGRTDAAAPDSAGRTGAAAYGSSGRTGAAAYGSSGRTDTAAYGSAGRLRKSGSDAAADAEAMTPAEKADPDRQKKAGRLSSPEDCQTCKTRKYQDGSDENVSFKSASHISPQAAGAAVRAHENEHVNNAYKKAAENNGEVLSATVAIHTAICPECGRSYVSGGTTNTMIKYTNEENPYQQELKKSDAVKLRGAHMDLVA